MRVAAELARAAQPFDARVMVQHGAKEADARHALNLMGLGALHGAELLIRAEGPAAEEAVAAIAAILDREEWSH